MPRGTGIIRSLPWLCWRSKKFTHIFSTQELLHVFSSSPFGKSRVPHKMFVTYTSYTAADFQRGHTNSSDIRKYESLMVQAWSYTMSFLMPSTVKISHRTHPDSRRKKIDPSSQLVRTQNLWPSLIHHDIKPDFRYEGKNLKLLHISIN